MTHDLCAKNNDAPSGCSCHPEDRPPICPREHARTHCWLTYMTVQSVDATRYAGDLAVSLHDKHYADNTQWRLLSGDLIGILTQIDNMTAGLESPKKKRQPEAVEQ